MTAHFPPRLAIATVPHGGAYFGKDRKARGGKMQVTRDHARQNTLMNNIKSPAWSCVESVESLAHLFSLSPSTKMPSFEQPTPEFGTTAPSRFAGDLPYHADDVERIILGIIALYDKLRNLPTLEPLPENVPIFNQLFDLVTTTKTTKEESERILKDPRVESILLDIREIWGTAEYYLERDFANSIICKGSTEACKSVHWH